MFGSPDYLSNPWPGTGYPYGMSTVTANPSQQMQFGMQQQPQQSQQQQRQMNNISVAFIRGGDKAADDYLMAPNQTIVLIDNESGLVYIKETNGSGMPVSNRKFKEEKPVSAEQMQANYITREEFEKRLAEIGSKQSIPLA